MAYGILCIAPFAVAAALTLAGSGYDDGGFGFAGFVVASASGVIAFPFLFVSEWLAAMNGGHVQSWHIVASTVAFVLAVLLSEGLWQLLKRRHRG